MAAFEVLDFWPDCDAAAGGAAVTVTWAAAGSTSSPPGSPRVMFDDQQACNLERHSGLFCPCPNLEALAILPSVLFARCQQCFQKD